MSKKTTHALNRRLRLANIPKSLIARDLKKLHATRAIVRAYPYTQLCYIHLIQMFDIIRTVKKERVRGSVVEMGAGRGGCSAFMAWCTEFSGADREVWAFDSFEGLSAPTEEDHRFSKKEPDRIQEGYLSVGQEIAEEAVQNMELRKPERVRIVKGWFSETLPQKKAEIGDIAVLRLDADLYEPTAYVLSELYSQVSSGGFVVIDDYENWVGARRAVHEFLAHEGNPPILLRYPHNGRFYFKKPIIEEI